MKIGDIITGDKTSGLKFSKDFKAEIVETCPFYKMRVLSGKYRYLDGAKR